MPENSDRELLIARPRGFCAGVERAIEVVERLLRLVGTPLYVRKQIVHNRAVVEDFRRRGVIFVDELEDVPRGSTVIFSAHGISPEVRRQAADRGLRVVDATCPLVTRVHSEVQRHAGAGRHIILIGHPGHDEVLGTMGEAPDSISLVTSLADVERLELPPDAEVAYVTQTTLSVDETQDIVTALRHRFARLQSPARSDICYATQNRQDAVKELASFGIEHLLVVGSASSSNSQRLCEVAERLGITATLIDGPEDLPPALLDDLTRLGLTAGASAPEHLLQGVVETVRKRGWSVREVGCQEKEVKFQLPEELSFFSE